MFNFVVHWTRYQLVFSDAARFPSDFNLEVEDKNEQTKRRINSSQAEAIREALTKRFTLIQGPPGKCVSSVSSQSNAYTIIILQQ